MIISNNSATCYLTDQNGILLDPLANNAIICEEVTGANARENVQILVDGQEVTLQKVVIRKRGFIVVQTEIENILCTSNPIPFCFFEEVLLCAPEGTIINCDTTAFNCFVNVDIQNSVFQSLEICLDICQSIKVVANANLTITGQLCESREVINPPSCVNMLPLIPPQCNIGITSDKQPVKRNNQSELPALKNLKEDISNSAPFQQEELCIRTKKVYDWITTRSIFRKTVEENPFICEICNLDLFIPAIIICERELSGTIECDGVRLNDIPVFFSASSDVVSFTPNPAITDDNGHFTTTIIVSEGTPLTEITVTATATVNGNIILKELPTIIECPAETCVLTLTSFETINCNGLVSGNVRCGNETIEGVEVSLTSDPPILTFVPNPTVTGSLGNYFSGVTVPNNTPPTDVDITATATVNGQNLMETITVNVECIRNCTLTITAAPTITCEGEITGTITCDGNPVEGASIEFSNFPSVGTFTPNPTVSGVDGSFTTTLTIPEGTPLISTAITATATVDSQTLSTTTGVQVECPEVECPCKFRLGIEGNAAPTIANITQNNIPSELSGTINITAIQCFTASQMCNPAVNNFNIAFGSNGTTINFVHGRRIEIECEDSNYARVRGTAQATGNLFSGTFEVTIEVSINPSNIGTWTIFATDFIGDTFATTFSAPMNPIAFIGACDEIP